MRLIDAHRLDLVDFPQDQIPQYAILSHTWTADAEVSFAEFYTLKDTPNAGSLKIERCCQQALRDGYRYVWVDTCCIDKSSSAELSEAINSMYRWYGRAEVCYAYLDDVPFDSAFAGQFPPFESSRWFTRGWTLQELLAPRRVHFFSREWMALGSKGDLQRRIQNATGIGMEILTGMRSIRSTSIAKRMSWAASRRTTRLEDIAYSLMGIFDVNMPMLYGEGHKAFQRLQEEIMKVSDDQSIFAWKGIDDDNNWYSGLLAHNPGMFKDCGSFEPITALGGHASLSDGRGIQMKVYLSPNAAGMRSDAILARPIFDAVLLCSEDNQPNKFATIPLVQLSATRRDFVRAGGIGLQTGRLHGKLEDITILRKPFGLTMERVQSRYFQICLNPLPLGTTAQVYTPAAGELPFLLKSTARDTATFADRPRHTDFRQVGDRAQFLVSNPEKHKYWLPFMPQQEALRIKFFKKPLECFAEVKLVIDDSGQLAFAAGTSHASYGEEIPGKLHKRSCQLPVMKRDICHMTLSAPDLNDIMPGDICKVRFVINLGHPKAKPRQNSDLFKLSELSAPVQKLFKSWTT